MTYQEIEQSIRKSVLNSDKTYNVLVQDDLNLEIAAFAKPEYKEEVLPGTSLLDAIKSCVDSNLSANMMICKIGSYWDFEIQAMYHDVRL